MSRYEKIDVLIDEEINQRLVAMMNEYVDIISKKHGISKNSNIQMMFFIIKQQVQQQP